MLEGNGALAITVVNRTESTKTRGAVASGRAAEEVKEVMRKLLGAFVAGNEGESDADGECDIDDNERSELARESDGAWVANELGAGAFRTFRA